MKKLLTVITLFASLSLFAENIHTVVEIQPPEGVVLEVGGMKIAKDGTVYVCTRRGNVWALKDGKWTQFAEGLQEALGLVIGDKKGEIYVLQRPELTRLVDEDGDGKADLYHSFSNGWGFSANYHEYAMGLIRDKEGNFYFGLGLPFYTKSPFKGRWLGTMDVADRGWYLKVDKNGNWSHYASGVREPVGGAINDAGDIFISDTQGSFVSTNYIIEVKKGDFLGHPDGLLWDKSKTEKVKTLLSMDIDARNKKLDEMRKKPVVYIPYREMGATVGSMQYDRTGGKFGPFKGQMLIADVIQPLIMRATIEKVNGVYQGAVFTLFRGGNLGGGSHKLEFDANGDLYIGQTARGWGKGQGLKKMSFGGKTMMDVLEMNLEKDGFTVKFTQAVDPTVGANKDSYKFEIFNYQFTHVYTAKQLNKQKLTVTGVTLAKDGLSAKVKIPGLKKDHVVGFDYSALKSAKGEMPANKKAYYTINALK